MKTQQNLRFCLATLKFASFTIKERLKSFVFFDSGECDGKSMIRAILFLLPLTVQQEDEELEFFSSADASMPFGSLASFL